MKIDDKEKGMQKTSQESMAALRKKRRETSMPYHLAMGRLFMLKKQYERANEYLTRAMQEDILVSKFFQEPVWMSKMQSLKSFWESTPYTTCANVREIYKHSV